MMSETRNGRRISARLAEKEDVPTTNGTSAQHTQHPEKTPGRSAKSGKTAGANGAAKVGRPKRKQGTSAVVFRLHLSWLGADMAILIYHRLR